MTKQITVIGLGQIGASIGLALAEYKGTIFRCGHDPDIARMNQVEKEGAFDKTFYRLSESVHDADLVILALPIDLIKDTLETIAEELKPGGVVFNTAIVRNGVKDWVKKFLPEGCSYLSIIPVINPEYLAEVDGESPTPHVDLFKNGELVIAAEANSDSTALQYAKELAAMLKTSTFYVDPEEADGMVAKVEQLPKLAAAALLDCLIDQPGWKDGRHLTSRAFLSVTSASLLHDEVEFLGIGAILNKENITRALSQYITSLQKLQNLINSGDEDKLREFLKKVMRDYETWNKQRQQGNWNAGGSPTQISGNIVARLFGGRTKPIKTD